VKALYSHAHTHVAINGILSRPFRVSRGVRQGDPLSCPLFDLAIEPLACLIRMNPNIHGLAIPCLPENLKIKMFADNTDLYLNKHNCLDTVQETLDHWCTASGAKFNIEKTEIIPIGSVMHRDNVLLTRKLNQQDQSPLPDQIHIAKDGEAVRILGVWIGNKADNLTPWEPIIDKIRATLKNWSKVRPSIEGKCWIIQAFVGGYTQFLTQAQGMPSQIETAINKIISDFIWDNGLGPRIAPEFLQQPKEKGGLNLLDISARNEAIDLMWLKAFLDFSPSRPPWAAVIDLIVDTAAPRLTIKQARKTPFLQCWNTLSGGPRAAKMNDDIRRMLKVAKSYNTNLAAVKMSARLRRDLPAWYHIDDQLASISSRAAKCLLTKHQVTTAADLVKMLVRIRNPHPPEDHRPNPFCPCRDCTTDQEKGCYNPHNCATEALIRLERISPRLSPLGPENPQDLLSLTPTCKATNTQARLVNDVITFDPTLTCNTDLAECFRVFVDPLRLSAHPALRHPPSSRNPSCPLITVYTDGACMNNGKRNASCGGGVWAGPNNPLNGTIRVPGPDQSNQVGEIVAIIVVVASIPLSQPLQIISDLKYTIDGLTSHLHSWENQGWIEIKNADFFKRAAYLLRRRTAPTYFKWVKGHDGNDGNEQSDRLAKEGAINPTPDVLDLSVLDNFNVQGAKLRSLTQALAYRGIRNSRPPPP